MKSQSIFSFLSLIFGVLLTFSLNAQDDVSADSTGYPGDGFSLEGALDLFKESESLEDFEKKLNAEDNSVNNLDLNEDDEVDYIRVVDNKEDKVHAIILTVPLNEKESQDVAVIEIEEQGEENTILQIVGDVDVYGEETFVEPFEEEAKSDGKGGPSANARIARVVVSVHFWPCVRFIYRPSYVVYASPWGWRVYPTYWRPWRPHPWRVHHSRVVVHRHHYHRVPTHRVVHAHKVYTPHRRTTTVVRTKTTTVRTTSTVKRTTTTNKATTTNKKATTTNRNTTTNKAATNKKATTTNKTSTQQKASTNNKATSGNKSTTPQNKANSTNNKSSTNKSTQPKTSQQKSSQQKSSQQKSSQQKSSQQKSSKKGGNRGGRKSGGGKGRKN